ncbi:MAG: prolyl oligopeptidase family serine peptidase [Ignavibacteriales bacterium]|nr:prolyl oligopeptidase family serine peptidase [Ignavibacteriales bacterium]
MKSGLRYTVIILSAVVFLSLDSFSRQVTPNKSTRGWLTVDTIMRDSQWMGASPSRVFWSEDGESLYVELGQGGAAAARGRGAEPDSLFVVSAKGGTPRLLTIEERKHLPGRTGVYSKDWSKKLYTKSGDIFLLDIRTKKEIQLTSTSTPESNPRFSSDEQKIVFERAGNLFVRDLKTAAEVQITNIQGGGAPQDSPRGAAEGQFSGFQGRGASRDALRADAPKYLDKQQMELFEVLRERKAERDAQKKLSELLDFKRPKQYNTGQKSAFGFLLSPDERFVTFTMTQPSTDLKRTIVPNYVTESGYTEDIAGRTKVGETPSVNEFYVYNIALDSVQQIRVDDIPGIFPAKSAKDTVRMRQRPRPVSFNGPYWSEDGKHAFAQVFSNDHKDRWIVLLEAEKAKFTTVLEHQHDDAWIGGPGIRGFGFGASVGWMPDSRRIYFQSEEDGWSHLYTVTLDGKIKTQLTKGTFEVYSPQISKDKKRWYFSSNEVHYGERHFYSMPLEGGQRTRITTTEGRNDVTLSPREDRAALLYSFSNKMPELYLMDNKPGAKAQQITFSASPEFRAYDWRAPEILTITARDSAAIPVRLYKPDHPNGAAVIFVHGAGYLQNAHKWWSEYFHEYMFNNLLADKGYTVLDLDYRGSAGLGRDWRTAVYRHMGGKDLNDEVDGAKWLVQNHGVDPKRIGLYGGSYGGFMTLMALFTAPDVFAAGAALRPVTDWAHYNQGYTSEILNIPQDDTLAYRQSSPIYFANGLKGALLICHGMVDENVHFQDAVRLVQRLIELKKDNWELAVFPVEDHGFKEPTSWMNEYKRILKLFETTLVGK